MITQKQLRRFVELTKTAVYDYSETSDTGLGRKKQEFRNLGRRILKDIADRMASLRTNTKFAGIPAEWRARVTIPCTPTRFMWL